MTDHQDATPTPARTYTVREIIRAASIATGFAPADLISHRRVRPLPRVRQAVIRLAKRRMPEMSFGHIARVLGGRDHTTIIHAVRLPQKAAAEADEIAKRIEAILDGPLVEITFQPTARRALAALPDGAITAVMRGATRAEVAAMYPNIEQIRS